MAELSTIARPYAEALFSAARADTTAAGGMAAWVAVIDELADVAGNPDVAAVIGDPNLSGEQVFGLLTGLMKSRLPVAAGNFLKLVIDNGRVGVLPEVARQFRQLDNEAEGAADCLIESAFALSEQQVTELVAGLARKFGLKLKPAVRVDPDLIGGVRISVGDHVLDSTVRTRLAQMHAALIAA